MEGCCPTLFTNSTARLYTMHVCAYLPTDLMQQLIMVGMT